jgi:hypothetical protein
MFFGFLLIITAWISPLVFSSNLVTYCSGPLTSNSFVFICRGFLMKQFIVLFLSGVLVISSCGPHINGKKSDQENPSNLPDGNNSQPLKNGNAIDPGLSASPDFIKFKHDFEVQFAGFKSLPVETLYQIIKAVPEQTATWSCGLVQSSMARASASVVLQLALNEGEISQCNVVNDYPLLLQLDKEVVSKIVTALPKLPVPVPALDNVIQVMTELEYDQEGNKFYFRVGALPSALMGYLNHKLPPDIRASLMAEHAMDATKLVKMIDDGLTSGMPIIVLIVNPNGISLHYVSIVGHDKDHVLVVDTKKTGIERMRAEKIGQFIKRLHTEGFKDFMNGFVPLITMLQTQLVLNFVGLTPEEKKSLPDNKKLEKALSTLASYNLITFKKL